MIDWERVSELQQEVGEEDFSEVLDMFFAEVDETAEGLPGADDETLATGLHFLKGAALNIGMAEVADLCRRAEGVLKADSGTAVDLSAIRTALATSQSELQQMLG